jgi:hypothetical protein
MQLSKCQEFDQHSCSLLQQRWKKIEDTKLSPNMF